MEKKKDYQKEERQQAIVDLVEQNVIKTQMELLDRLGQAGYKVTQATISRDIRELQIGKSADENGHYKYVITRKPETFKRFEMLFGDSVLQVDYAGYTVLVKCHTGMANAVCEVFDGENLDWGDVVGTMSGDNTFAVYMRTEDEARRLCAQLKRYIL